VFRIRYDRRVLRILNNRVMRRSDSMGLSCYVISKTNAEQCFIDHVSRRCYDEEISRGGGGYVDSKRADVNHSSAH
jgi:hypothetical protein